VVVIIQRGGDYPPCVEPGTKTAAIDWELRERFLSLRRDLGVTAFGLNQLTLQPGQRGRIHRHGLQEEVYLVLRGTLTVKLEDAQAELREGELLRVAPEVRRQLVNASDRPCVSSRSARQASTSGGTARRSATGPNPPGGRRRKSLSPTMFLGTGDRRPKAGLLQARRLRFRRLERGELGEHARAQLLEIA